MLVKYYGTDHCPMCKALRPRVEKWCKDNKHEFEYCDAELPERSDELRKYRIMSVPAVVMIENDMSCTIRGIDGWNTFIESYKTDKNENI